MTWRKPLIKPGVREPPYLHYIKLCWFEYHFEDVTDEASRKYFIEHFYEIAKDMAIFEKIEKNYGISFNFKNKDGTPKTFDYDSMHKNQIFGKYEWDDLYKLFKIDKLKNTTNTARERVERSMDKDTITDLKQLQETDKDFDESEDAGDRLKIQKMKSLIFERIQKRVGLDEDTINLNFNSMDKEVRKLTSEDKERIRKVSSKPDEETQKFLEEIGYEN